MSCDAVLMDVGADKPATVDFEKRLKNEKFREYAKEKGG